MDNTIIFTINEEEYNEAMKMLDNLGYKWCDGDSCTTGWKPADGVDRLIYLNLYDDSKTISFSPIKPEGRPYPLSLKVFKRLKEVESSFTKADLEDGMVIQTYDNQYYMYFKKFRKFIGEDGFLWTDSYNNDLTYKYEEDSVFNVKTVFATKNLYSLNLFDEATKYSGLEKIWERPEKVRMTIKEIEEKLGIKNLEIVEE